MRARFSDDPGELRRALQAAGLRVTQPRIAVLTSLARRSHASAEDVCETVRTALPRTSLQAVYNVLGDLTAAGLLRRLEPAGSRALYERRVGDNHHHLVCRTCGTIRDIDCTIGISPCLAPESTHGFSIDEAEVTFWGLCPSCTRRDAHETTPTTGGE